MPKINKEHSKGFTTACNQAIQDGRLTWKSRAVFMYLYSLPNDWTFHERELAKHSWTEGLEALTSAIRQLRQYHYLTITKTRNKHGQIKKNGDIWNLNDQPHNYYITDMKNARQKIFPLSMKPKLKHHWGSIGRFLPDQRLHLEAGNRHEAKMPLYQRSHLMSITQGQGTLKSGHPDTTKDTIYKRHSVQTKSGRKSKSKRNQRFNDQNVELTHKALIAEFPKCYNSEFKAEYIAPDSKLLAKVYKNYPRQLVDNAFKKAAKAYKLQRGRVRSPVRYILAIVKRSEEKQPRYRRPRKQTLNDPDFADDFNSDEDFERMRQKNIADANRMRIHAQKLLKKKKAND